MASGHDADPVLNPSADRAEVLRQGTGEEKAPPERGQCHAEYLRAVTLPRRCGRAQGGLIAYARRMKKARTRCAGPKWGTMIRGSA